MMDVRTSKRSEYEWLLLNHHYAGRVPSVSHAFGLYENDSIIGVITFGTPAARQIQTGACPSNPSAVIELNRLCVLDSAPRNTESWFISRAMKMLPSFIVVSYADTMQGHTGVVYRAANFNYAGWSDMDRKTPRYDYVVPGKHSRNAFRGDAPQFTEKVRRRPKVKYWTVTGNRREQHELTKICMWQSIRWQQYPPPMEHMQLIIAANDNVKS